MSTTKRLLWLLCLVISAGFLLAGCGEDDTQTSNDATDNTDTAGSCNEAECALQGKECNIEGTACVVVGEGDCAEVNVACELNQTQPDGFVCVEASDGSGTCAETCNSFFDNTCTDGQKCYPKELFDTDFDVCNPTGTGTDGQTCETIGSCGLELLCVGTCSAPDCTPLTTGTPCAGAGEECSGLSLNSGVALDIGFCYTPCEAFKDPSDCAADEYCTPTGRNSSTGKLDGSCGEANTGNGVKDASCSSDNDCAVGFACIGGNCGQLCDTEAETGGQGACGDTEGCSGLQTQDDEGNINELPFGVCADACDYDDPSALTCPNVDDYCIPGDVFGDASFDSCRASDSFQTVDEMIACPTGAEFAQFCGVNSLCLDFATLPGGDTLTCYDLCRFSEGSAGDKDHKDCSPDRYCARIFNEQVAAGLCLPYECDPTVVDPTMNGCENAEYCRANSAENTTVGACYEECDPEAANTCTEEGADCTPSHFLGLFTQEGVPAPTPEAGGLCDVLRPADVTTWPLNERDNCVDNGYEEFSACGPASFCIEFEDLAPGVLCYDTCDLRKGTGENHPDCNAGRTCTRTLNSEVVGICTG